MEPEELKQRTEMRCPYYEENVIRNFADEVVDICRQCSYGEGCVRVDDEEQADLQCPILDETKEEK